MKKAQVTIFVIIGIIVVAVIFLAAYYKTYVEKASLEEEIVKGVVVNPEIQDVADYLNSCVKEVGGVAIQQVFAQGGFWQTNPYFSQGPLEVGYWYYEGQDNSPKIGDVEKSLEEFVNFYLPECLYDFQKADTWIIEIQPKTKAKITNDQVVLEVSYPADVVYKDIFYSIPEDPFVVEFDSDFKEVYNAGKQIVEMEVKDPEYIDNSLIVKLGYDVTYLPNANEEGLYLISGKFTDIMFANKF
ncbi:hypothetical protein HY643_04505 [Candidatus Woesearchaeota archaeon]|nr:hypothetical protein [Candidatus Woesearchaeota archaeon]